MTDRHPPPSSEMLGQLTIVRHGQSVGNVADTAAQHSSDGRLVLETRDADTPLSEAGEEQARSLGAYVAGLSDQERPQLVMSSPYVRAARTAELAVGTIPGLRPIWDERLRERDLGAFDGLTSAGIRAEYPAESERRAKMGKFYYRPPGGESWTDVALRVRQLMSEVRTDLEARRVWMFTHQAVIMCFRFILEGLSEQQVLEIAPGASRPLTLPLSE